MGLGLALAVGLAACGGDSQAPGGTDGPPVVVLLLDALHAPHVSHLGNPRATTPNLDALAAEGVTFTRAIAPAPYTLATVSSILTGRLPDVHGLVDKGARLLDEEVTLAEVLARDGYETYAAVGNLNGSSIFNCDQGFETYEEIFRPLHGRSVDVEFDGEAFHLARAVDYPPVVRRWLEGLAPEATPFFYLHILEPHEPYSPPEEFRARWVDPEYQGPYHAGDSASLIRGRRGEMPFEPADKEALEAMYDANLAHVDQVVGEIFDLLRARGLWDEALVVVTSDHGEAFWQHGEQGHNTTLYDEMLHVPLIVRFPKGSAPVPPGTRVDELVSPMDLLPSLCEWLNLPLPRAGLDGVGLGAVLRGEADPERALILRSHHDPPWFGLRTATRKTIAVQHEGQAGISRVEHYRLDQDPAEAQDLGPGAAAADVERLRSFAVESARTRASRDLPLSSAEQQMLEQLGYVGDD